MVVKIDNTDSSSPQLGLGKADLVTEELVEGGSTRLAVFFYQHVPKLRRPGAVDAGHRHRHRQAGQGRAGRQRWCAADRAPHQGRRHQGLHRGRDGLPAATAAAARRTTCSWTSPELAKTRQGQGHRATATCRSARRRTCRRARRPAASPRSSPAGTPRTGSSRAGSTPTRTASPQAGDQFRPDNVLVLRVQGRRRRLQGPGRQPGPGDEVHRHRQGDALPRRPRGARHLEEVAGLDDHAEHQQAGELAVPAGSHLDRAGARRTAATSPSRSSGRTAQASVLDARRESGGRQVVASAAGPAAGRPDSAIARRPARM